MFFCIYICFLCDNEQFSQNFVYVVLVNVNEQLISVYVMAINIVHFCCYFFYVCHIVFSVDRLCFPYLSLPKTHPVCPITALTLPFSLLLSYLLTFWPTIFCFIHLPQCYYPLMPTTHQTSTAFHLSSTSTAGNPSLCYFVPYLDIFYILINIELSLLRLPFTSVVGNHFTTAAPKRAVIFVVGCTHNLSKGSHNTIFFLSGGLVGRIKLLGP